MVAGQAPKAETPPPFSDESELVILLRGDGLSVETPGHGSPLRFGSTTPDVAAGALSALGEPKRSSNSECPAGPLDFMDWDDGLQLAFQDGKLAGWWAKGGSPAIATAAGLRPGSPRSAIGSTPVEDVSIGKVFTVDSVNGILDEETGTRVEALWAGLACIFD